MARSEHNRDAYRALFGYVGAGLQVFGLLMILVSVPIAPVWLVILLLVVGVALSVWSWTKFSGNFMMPTFAGTLIAVSWMVAIGVGVGIMGWGS